MTQYFLMGDTLSTRASLVYVNRPWTSGITLNAFKITPKWGVLENLLHCFFKEIFAKARTGGCCHLNDWAMPQSWIPCQLCIGCCKIEVWQQFKKVEKTCVRFLIFDQKFSFIGTHFGCGNGHNEWYCRWKLLFLINPTILIV